MATNQQRNNERVGIGLSIVDDISITRPWKTRVLDLVTFLE